MSYLERAQQIINNFLSWLNDPQQPAYWGYLLATLLIAMSVYFFRDRKPTQSVRHVFAYCFPKNIYFNRSFVHDILFLVINIVIISYISIAATKIGEFVYHGLDSRYGVVINPLNGVAASIIYTAAVMLIMDLGFFISHYLHHKVPLLWEFHKVHHTAPVLNPLTAFRRHPIDYLIESNIIAVLLGLVIGLFGYWSNDQLTMLNVLGVNAGIFLFFMVGSHLQHSHIWLSYGPLNKIFVSPAMHHIHHSSAPEHLDKNMGSMFSIWDWIMRTRYIPLHRESLTLGLAENDSKGGSFVSMCFRPFVSIFSRKKQSRG